VIFANLVAGFLIDNKLYGRKHMMTVGFLLDFVLFIVPGFHYHYYTEKNHIKAFQAMYFLSSFFNQFGPNSVTFIAAAEVYPTAVRATAHGFSAACGKLGALTAAILYNYISTQTKFYVVPWFGLAGMLLTIVFLPDTTGLDLKEQERRWAYIRAGRQHEYHGVAVHPKHLSLWERIRGVGKHYDADLDYKQKIEEMRTEWEEHRRSTGAEHVSKLEREDFEDEKDFSHAVNQYFRTTSRSPVMSSKEKTGLDGNGNAHV
jgi:Sugar (and other) transporter